MMIRAFRKPGWICLLVFSMAAQGQIRRDPAPEQGQRELRHKEAAWFLRGRTARPGQSAAELRLRAWQTRLQRKSALFAGGDPVVAGSTTEWIPLGPAPLASDASGFGFRDYNWVSGRATAVAIDASDPTGNTVYVGGAYGGLWKSTNAATPLPSNVVWTPLLDEQATLAVGAVAIRPGSSSTVLVGTGETNSSTDSYYGLGLLRSVDGGTSWSLITESTDGHPFRGMGFAKIAFSTDNTALVVAGAGFAAQGVLSGLESGAHRGIYVSTDAGTSWRLASVKDGSTTITPSSVTSVVYNRASHKFFAAVRRHGLYSSTDGVNWTRLTSQPGSGALSASACPPDAQSNGFACPIYRAELAVVPGRDEVYVWYMDLPGNTVPATDRGTWRSVNGGPWTQIASAGIAACGDPSGCGAEQGDYNLAISAVANGERSTDLYAGAVNLFKCTLADGAVSTGCNGGAWLNLTHAYGCSEVARVHPNQHAMQFAVASGKAIGYFANDGGIYRTLDGFMGLNAGSCGGTNQFDSLNETLGSMGQFVSFSQHPTDANVLLGGTQGNGSPATNQSQISSVFVNVLAGDGGHTAITPSSPARWFASTPDVPPAGLGISQCDMGIDCRSGDFSLVAGSSDLGGDDGPFYVPFMLDPQAEGQLLIGTCRVWRAAVDGSSFTPISTNFDAGSGSCTGSEVNQVRALAAGGPKGPHGFSGVVYVTTEGDGPMAELANPRGGRIFVSTNADSSSPVFEDVTRSLNQEQFPVSGVAIDSSDSTGRTAFVTVMGFGASHVFKTVDAGASWTDFGSAATGLPDAPANYILVDASAGMVYVGTDVGVFASSTSAPNWTLVGPASGRGHLPNVPVTALRLFNPDPGTKKLRASTYGRGIWEYNLVATPDFRMVVSAPTKTVFAGQQATFNGSLISLNGYASVVSLTCSGTSQPSTCTPAPTAATPSRAGTPFSVTAAGTPGTYSFNLHAQGADEGHITHDASLVLEVVDFSIGTASPTSVRATRPNISEPATFTVSAFGPFEGTVSLSCSNGLPAGSTCLFSPGASVTPTSGVPATVSLTIATTGSTPTGNFPVTIQASTAGAPGPRNTTVTLIVSAAPDYTLTIDNTPLSAAVGEAREFTGQLTSLNGYASTVTVKCGSGAPPTCTGGNFLPTASGTPVVVTVSSPGAENYDFRIEGTGQDSAGTVHSVPVRFESISEFSMRTDSGTQTVKAGGTASYTLNMSPGGSSFSRDVTFACSASGLPSLSHCAFTPATIPAGSGPASVTLRISTTAAIASLGDSVRLVFYGVFIPLPGIVVMLCRGRSAGKPRKHRRRMGWLGIGLAALLLVSACGGGGGDGGGGGGHPGTPPGAYDIRVTATSGSQTQQLTVQLVVQ